MSDLTAIPAVSSTSSTEQKLRRPKSANSYTQSNKQSNIQKSNIKFATAMMLLNTKYSNSNSNSYVKPSQLNNFYHTLSCPICWQLFENYMLLDESIQLSRSTISPLQSPFARILRMEKEHNWRVTGQGGRDLCYFHRGVKRCYDLMRFRKRFEIHQNGGGDPGFHQNGNAGGPQIHGSSNTNTAIANLNANKMPPHILQEIIYYTKQINQDDNYNSESSSSSSIPPPNSSFTTTHYICPISSFIKQRYSSMLQEVQETLTQDSLLYKEKNVNELYEVQKSIQKEVSAIGQKWVEFGEREKKGIRKGMKGSRNLPKIENNNSNTEATKPQNHNVKDPKSANLIHLEHLQQQLTDSNEFEEAEKIQLLINQEQLDSLKRKQFDKNLSEKYKFDWLDKQIQQTFNSQRDKLFNNIKLKNKSILEKESNIDKRVEIVMNRLKSEQEKEIRAVMLLFWEHCKRCRHFLKDVGNVKKGNIVNSGNGGVTTVPGVSRREQFQPFKALKNEGSGEKGSGEGSGSGSTSWVVEESGVFEFASKLLAEEMRILEHKRVALPEPASSSNNLTITSNQNADGTTDTNGNTKGHTHRTLSPHQIQEDRKKSVMQRISEQKPGYTPMLTEFNAKLLGDFVQSQKENHDSGGCVVSFGYRPGKKNNNNMTPGNNNNSAKNGINNKANNNNTPQNQNQGHNQPEQNAILKTVNTKKSNLTELFAGSNIVGKDDLLGNEGVNRDVYVAKSLDAVNKECCVCGNKMSRDLICTLLDVDPGALPDSNNNNIVIQCCSWNCCTEYNSKFSPPYLREKRDQYIQAKIIEMKVIIGAAGGDKNGKQLSKNGDVNDLKSKIPDSMKSEFPGPGTNNPDNDDDEKTQDLNPDPNQPLPTSLTNRFGKSMQPQGPDSLTQIEIDGDYDKKKEEKICDIDAISEDSGLVDEAEVMDWERKEKKKREQKEAEEMKKKKEEDEDG